MRLAQPPSVVSYANIGGKFEGNGPLAEHFDQLCPDSFFGKDTWEQAESAMQQRVLERALEKGGLMPKDLDYVLAGDLLTSASVPPLACGARYSRFLAVRGLLHHGGESGPGQPADLRRPRPDDGLHDQLPFLHRRAAVPHAGAPTAASGPPRPSGPPPPPAAASWRTRGTAVYHPRYLREDRGQGHHRREQHGGRHGPAACDTLSALFRETKTGPWDYDLIVTGDLGVLGHAIVTDLLGREGVDLSRNYQDCGMLLYDLDKQDMHAGASGCGCSGSGAERVSAGRYAAGQVAAGSVCPHRSSAEPYLLLSGGEHSRHLPRGGIFRQKEG